MMAAVRMVAGVPDGNSRALPRPMSSASASTMPVAGISMAPGAVVAHQSMTARLAQWIASSGSARWRSATA